MSTTLYSAQIHRPALQRWSRRIPREVGAALISEAVQDLMHGDCSTLKGLPFVSRLNARRKHRTKPAGVVREKQPAEPKSLRLLVMRDRLAGLRKLARSGNTTVEALVARRLLSAPI